MNHVFGELFGVALTGWKLVGYLGVFLFAGRWFVQVIAAHSNGRPVIPRLFWIMSLSGSLLLLSYFIFGRNDSVGVLSNLFPALVALYNLALDLKSERLSRRERSVQLGDLASMRAQYRHRTPIDGMSGNQ